VAGPTRHLVRPGHHQEQQADRGDHRCVDQHLDRGEELCDAERA